MRRGGGPNVDGRRPSLSRGGAFALAGLLAAAALPDAALAAPAGRSDPDPMVRQYELRRLDQPDAARSSLRLPRLGAPAEPTGTAPLFVLRSIAFAGNTAIPDGDLLGCVGDFTGKPVSERDLWEITQRLTRLYQDRGYFLSRALVLPQDAKAGRLVVALVEGHVVDIALRGDHAGRYGLEAVLQPIRAERPLRLATFERRLLLASDVPGVRIADSAIEEVDAPAGAYRLVVTVQAWGSMASGTVDNRVSAGSAPLKGTIEAELHSVLTGGDSFGVAVAGTPRGPRELAFGGAVADLPIGHDGTRLALYGTYSDFAPSDQRRLIDTDTVTSNLGAQLSVVPVRSLDATLRLSGGLAATWAREDTVFGETYDDTIVAATFGFELQAPDRLGGTNYLSGFVRQGLDAIGASQRWDIRNSRIEASGEFTKAGFAFSRIQPLGKPWSVRVAATGQVAADPLLSSEQFYIGGATFGRAYTNGEVGGDQGLAGLAELRYDLPVEGTPFELLQLYGFVDGGAVDDRGFGAWTYFPMFSTGGGIRFGLGEEVNGSVEIAVPFGGYAASTLDQHTRVFFSLTTALKGCARAVVCLPR